MSSATVRRVDSGEWRSVRALRLRALEDPDAAIAFLETRSTAEAQPDDFWIARTEAAAVSDTVAQFIAEADGSWVGTVSVLIREDGTIDHLRHVVQGRRADVVGVFVAPEARGTGVIGALLDTVADWTRQRGLTALHLDVHADNERAHAAYARAGFAPTGTRFTGPIGEELQMLRVLDEPAS